MNKIRYTHAHNIRLYDNNSIQEGHIQMGTSRGGDNDSSAAARAIYSAGVPARDFDPVAAVLNGAHNNITILLPWCSPLASARIIWDCRKKIKILFVNSFEMVIICPTTTTLSLSRTHPLAGSRLLRAHILTV